MGRRATFATLLLLVAIVVVALSATFPIGISYAVSDSMEPTIDANDGFVRVPAGNVEPGDIVVFESPSRERQYTVHRVVRETPDGFVTMGDNNEVTDQAAGAPLVQREQIHGAVWTVAGEPVIIPDLGVLIQFVKAHQTLLFGFLVGFLALDTVTEQTQSGRPIRAGDALKLVTVVAVVGLVVLVLLGGATSDVSFVAVADGGGAPQTVPVGERANKSIHVTQISKTPLTHYAVDASGLTVTGQQWNGSTFTLTTSIPPQQSTGVHETTIAVHAYPVSLPPPLIDRLHAVHPLLAAVLTAVAAVGPWYLAGWLVVDSSARLRIGQHSGHTQRLLRRWL